MTSENSKQQVHDRRTTSTDSDNNMGYLVFSGRELQRWNLKFLVYHDEEQVSFCETDFYVKKILKHDQMFIYCFILDSSWSKKDLKRQIRKRAPHADMNDEAFFWAHKSYKKELESIQKKSWKVKPAPDSFLPPDQKKRVKIIERTIAREKKWLKNHPKATRQNRQKHEKLLRDLQNNRARVLRFYDRQDEPDPWSDCETTYDDFELYHF